MASSDVINHDMNEIDKLEEQTTSGDTFDLKIDAVFSLACNDLNTSSQSSNELADLNDTKENALTVSPKQSPTTKACSVILKKISNVDSLSVGVSDRSLLSNCINDDTSKARPSRKRKPSSLLVSDAFVKSADELNEFRAHIKRIAIAKRLKHLECSQGSEEKEMIKDSEKDTMILSDNNNEIDDKKYSPAKEKKKKKRKKDVDMSGVDNVLTEQNDEEKCKQAQEGKTKKSKKKKSDPLSSDTCKTDKERKRSKLSKNSSVPPSEIDTDFRYDGIQTEKNKTVIVQNVSEFPKETKMKSLLNHGLSSCSNTVLDQQYINQVIGFKQNIASQDKNITSQDKEMKTFVGPKTKRVPCTLTGRCVKPNNKYSNEYLTDFSVTRNNRLKKETSIKLESEDCSSAKNETLSVGGIIAQESAECSPTIAQNKPVLASLLQDETDVHASQSVMGSSSSQSVSTPQIGLSNKLLFPLYRNAMGLPISVGSTPLHNTNSPQGFTSTSNASLAQNYQPPVCDNLGISSGVLNTKKFFHLQVGDKVVLIPTDGDTVIPKAYVMDVKQSEQFQSRLQTRKSCPDAPVKITYKSAVADGKAGETSHVPPSVNTAVSLLANTATTTNILPSINQAVSMLAKSLFSPNQQVSAVSITQTDKIVSNEQREISMTGSADEQSNNVMNPYINFDERYVQNPSVKIKSEPVDDDFQYEILGTSSFVQEEPERFTSVKPDDNIQTPPLLAENKANESEIMIHSPPLLTKIEPDPVPHECDLHSPPLLTKNVTESCEKTQMDTSTEGDDQKDKMASKVDTNVPTNETEAQIRIRKLKEKLRQKQTEIANFKKNVGGNK